MSRRLTATAAGLLLVASIAIAPAAGATSLARAAAAAAPLTNLAHLDFLTDHGDPTAASRAHHLPARHRALGRVLWVYANYLAPGSYQVAPGGTCEARTTPTGRAPTTPTTSPAPRSSTCSTGCNSATSTAATRPTSCCAG